jgi:hypothetical protein
MKASLLGKKVTFSECERCEECLKKKSYNGNWLDGTDAFTLQLYSVCGESGSAFGSVVGIATGYGLDGPEIEFR